MNTSNIKKAADHVFEKPEGWYATVNGNVYGYWRSRAEAIAGMEVEQRRAANKLIVGGEVKAAMELREKNQ